MTKRTAEESGSARTGRRDPWTIAVAVVGVAVVAVLIAVVVKSAGDDDPAVGGPAATATAQSEPGTTLFAPDDHTNLPAEPGCDQLSFHSAMQMWNPALADEMLTYDCPFPFDAAAVSMEGGAEDPALAAPFEPHRYQEIFDVITAERIGTCSIGRTPDPSVRGFVYGFIVRGRAETCAENNTNIEVVIREYATRAHRDEAAHALIAPSVQVFGRWTIAYDGSDPEAIRRLAESIAALGAVPVA